MRFQERGLACHFGVIGRMAVMHQNIIGDEVMGVGNGQIVCLFFADIFDGDDFIPIDVAFRILTQFFAVKISGQAMDGVTAKSFLCGGVGWIKFTRGDTCLLV